MKATTITQSEIRAIKKHLAATHHDQEWWDYTESHLQEIKAVTYAIEVQGYTDFGDIQREAESYISAVSSV